MKIRLLKTLADGRFHSGEKLGQQFGISRTAVWKHIKSLQQMGLDFYSVTGKGHRLATPIELLERQAIEAAIEARALLSNLEIHHEIHSTNRHLMENLGNGLNSGHVCLAESQTEGRGRRGRAWISPFARNIYLSLYWRFEMAPSVLSGLGLAVGVALIRALNALGIEDARLKWPNDVIWQGRKLAGILLEMNGETSGPYHVVIGVGLNVNMTDAGTEIDQPWVDLNSAAGTALSRNRVAGVVLSHLLEVAQQFQLQGLAPFLAEWQQADAYAGQRVAMYLANETVIGEARGIDASGAFLLQTDKGLRQFHSGEVSLRPWH